MWPRITPRLGSEAGTQVSESSLKCRLATGDTAGRGGRGHHVTTAVPTRSPSGLPNAEAPARHHLSTCHQSFCPPAHSQGRQGRGLRGRLVREGPVLFHLMIFASQEKKSAHTGVSSYLTRAEHTHPHTHRLLSNSTLRDATVDSLKPAMMEGFILPKWVNATSRDFSPESQLINIQQHPRKFQPGVLSPSSAPGRHPAPVHSPDPRSRTPRELWTPRATSHLLINCTNYQG